MPNLDDDSEQDLLACMDVETRPHSLVRHHGFLRSHLHYDLNGLEEISTASATHYLAEVIKVLAVTVYMRFLAEQEVSSSPEHFTQVAEL